MTEALRELSGAWNFRDVADGASALRPGRLFRSGELSRLDDDGRATLLQLGITDVADLRARREVTRRGPGLVPDGVEIHLLPFPDLGAEESDTDGQARFTSGPLASEWTRMSRQGSLPKSLAMASAMPCTEKSPRSL